MGVQVIQTHMLQFIYMASFFVYRISINMIRTSDIISIAFFFFTSIILFYFQ